jgi:uncharacterized protein with PIN domain
MVASLPVVDWQRLADEVWTGLAEWRTQHPKATLAEIEAALDERLADLRARLVQDLALASAATDLRASPECPSCPECGRPMQAAGRFTRHLTTRHERPIALTRSYARCPACGAGLFPPR